jgi:hypothetical protein
MASPAPQPAADQRIGSWIFGGLLLAFYLGVFLFGPSILPDYKYRMLGIISALLGGLFAYFLTGSIVTSAKRNISGSGQIALRAGGGFGLACVLLVWWEYGAPVQPSSQAAAELQQKLQAAASGETLAPVSSSPAAKTPAGVPSSPPPKPAQQTVTLSPATQKLAADLAAADPKYRELVTLQNKKTVSLETLSRASAFLRTQAKR